MQRSYVRDLWFEIAAASLLPHRWRTRALRRAGLMIGDGVLVMARTRFNGSAQIEVGSRTFINSDCFFDAAGPITIGEQVRIGDHVRLITSTHEIGSPSQRAAEGYSQAVHVEDGAWLASGVTVLPGVTIAAGCVIAAGAVVTRTTSTNGLYAGVPARRIRDLAH